MFAAIHAWATGSSPELHTRKLVSFTVLIAVVCVVSMAVQSVEGVAGARWGTGLMLLASLGALLALRARVRPAVVATAFVSLGTVVAALLAMTAGNGSLSAVWLIVVPLIATALGGRRAGWATLVLSLVVIPLVLLGVEERWLMSSAEPTNASHLWPRVTTLMSTCVTIFLVARTYELETERRIAQLLEAQRLTEQASRARTQFLATISHELRTPLNGLIGMIEALREERRPERLGEGFNVLHSSADTLLALINDVLDFAKIEAGALVLERVPISPEAAVRTVVDVLSNRASERGTRLALEVAPGVPRWVVGDATRLQQIVFNLVGNAIKFTERGEVSVSLGWASGALTLAVRDTGVGMTADTLQRLCTPFVQADASTTRKHGGTGLGLAITRRLVEAMGGTFAVVSAPGDGSTFRIEVPCVESPAPAPVAVPANADRALEVLVVDDNGVNQLVAQRVLERFGHRVTIASNGQEALDVLSTRTFDVVLMDCHMPVMDGYEATRIARERGVRVPIFALTAAATAEDHEICLAAGMERVLTKPLRIEQLKEALADVARQMRAAA